MTIDNVAGYSDFNKLIEYLENYKMKDTDIIAMPMSFVSVCSAHFINHDYSFGIWISKDMFTIHEFGFNKIPKQVFYTKDVYRIDFDNNILVITFKPNCKNKVITIDFNQLSNSIIR